MAHYPKPFSRKGRGVWYVEIDRKQFNLGPDREEAFRRYHALMAQPRCSRRPWPSNTVAGIINTYLKWCQRAQLVRVVRYVCAAVQRRQKVVVSDLLREIL